MSDEPIDETILPYEAPSGLWKAMLEDADKVDVTLTGESSRRWKGCTVLAVDRDAVLLRHKSGTLLVPRSAIAFVRLSDDQEHIAERRAMWNAVLGHR